MRVLVLGVNVNVGITALALTVKMEIILQEMRRAASAVIRLEHFYSTFCNLDANVFKCFKFNLKS